jgi:hypothetical protein
MIEAGTITGTIESNNGTEALVSFADGAQILFERTAESETDFLANLPIGGTTESKRFACDISTRQDIFAALEYLFRDRGIAYSVGVIERGDAPLVGLVLNISGLAVFCAPVFESPDGGDGRYLALGRGEHWEWLEVSLENFEYVCGEIGKAAAKELQGLRGTPHRIGR